MRKQLLIKKPLGVYKAGETIYVDCDKAGIPLDQYWRNRLKDSVVDGCVEEIQPEKPIAKKEEKKEVKISKDKPLTKATT